MPKLKLCHAFVPCDTMCPDVVSVDLWMMYTTLL